MEAATAPAAKTEPAPKAEPADQGTHYVILERVQLDGGAHAWREVDGAWSQAGSDPAIKRSREGHKGAFKAVPVRNWKGGLELGTETKTVTVSKPLRD